MTRAKLPSPCRSSTRWPALVVEPCASNSVRLNKIQGWTLLKKAEEIFASKNNNTSTRMHRAKVAQRCAAQKGANPLKRTVSEQSKGAVCEQQNASRKCSNEYVATKKQGRSRYARKDSSKITVNTLLRVQALPARFPPKTCYKRFYERATRRATSVQQDAIRVCNKARYERAIDTSRAHTLHECNRHAIVCNDTLRRARIKSLFTTRGSYQPIFTIRGSYHVLVKIRGRYQTPFHHLKHTITSADFVW